MDNKFEDETHLLLFTTRRIKVVIHFTSVSLLSHGRVPGLTLIL
jgi:hypothetical protein